MKAILFISLKLSLAVVFLAFCTTGFSQKVIIWKGGTPGMKNDWNCPQNWSTSTVPDEFSNVYIHDVSTSSLSSPVIKSGDVEVNQIWIGSNAMLTIENGAQLTIQGHVEGISDANLRLEGKMFFPEEKNDLALKAMPWAKN